MKLLGFGIFSITIIYPLLSPFSHLLRTIVSNKFKYTMTKGLVKGGLMYIAEIILGCIYVIYKFFQQRLTLGNLKEIQLKWKMISHFLNKEKKKYNILRKYIYMLSFLVSQIC